MASKYHGSCLCGSIKYEITGEPFTFFVCHCNNCRKATGSAFMANAFFKTDQVIVTQGDETMKRYRDSDTASGTSITRTFCSNCGSSLFIINEKHNCAIVATGTVDGHYDWAPQRESFPERRRHWVTSLAINPKSRSKL